MATGYALTPRLKGLTAIWFTTNANQSYGGGICCTWQSFDGGLQHVQRTEATMPPPSEADTPPSGSMPPINAAAVFAHRPGKGHIDKFAEAFQAGASGDRDHRRHPDGSAVTPAQPPSLSEFGTADHREERRFPQLVPATYQFDSVRRRHQPRPGHGGHRPGAASVSAPALRQVDQGAPRLGIDNQWKDGEDVPKFDEIDGVSPSAPDYSYGNLYPYMVL